MLASGLAGKPGNFINSDVALDSEPVIGSFTVDGLTYAVINESHVELVGVSSSWQQVMSLPEGEGSDVAPMLASGSDGAESEAPNLVLPESVSCEGTNYTLTSIASYAFYLSGVASVTLPASVNDVDDRAFRSSDVANVAVAEGNQTYSSFDGALYDAEQLSLLLIPEGKQGAVLLPKTAEVAEASVFSHCPLVDSISVEKDGAAFASENGLLYSSDLTTLLRVPAGATEITIREGCTTIAAGALEACAKLTTINAPASVTSISPDVFHAIPTVSLPAASVILREGSESAAPSAILSEGVESDGVEEPDESYASEAGSQLIAMVALSAINDDLPEMNPSIIALNLSEDADASLWRKIGLAVEDNQGTRGGKATLSAMSVFSQGVLSALGRLPAVDDHQTASTYGATVYTVTLNHNGADTHDSRTAIYTPGTGHGDAWYTTAACTTKIQRITVPTKRGYTFEGYKGYSWATGDEITYITATGLISAGDGNVKGNVTLTAQWKPNVYSVTLNKNTTSTDSTKVQTLYYKYGTAALYIDSNCATVATASNITLPVRSGYTFLGYRSGRSSGTSYISSSRVPQNLTSSLMTGNSTWYAQWNNLYKVVFDNQAATTAGTSTAYVRHGSVQWYSNSACTTTLGAVTLPRKTGYTFMGYYLNKEGTGTRYVDPNSGKLLVGMSDDLDKVIDGQITLYAKWELNAWTITLDDRDADMAGSGAVYVRYGDGKYYADQDYKTAITQVKVPGKTGYVFMGYYTALNGGARFVSDKGVLLAGTGNYTADTTLYAHWKASISAVVPLEVEAKVDVLGLEAPKEAQGYIESRCGEPLKVARADLAPLDGATELFGEDNVADVFLEVLANGSASPVARFSLGAPASESDAAKLRALTMAGYGTRVPIGYRFAMPPEVQTSLVESSAAKPVCSVAYTVALA